MGTVVVIAGYSSGGVRLFHSGNGTVLGSTETGSAVLAVKRSGQVSAGVAVSVPTLSGAAVPGDGYVGVGRASTGCCSFFHTFRDILRPLRRCTLRCQYVGEMLL